MMRLFRNVKDKLPVPSNDDCILDRIKRVDTVAEEIERKIAELNSQLIDYKYQMEIIPFDECPSKKMMKQKAIRLLKRKRLYQHQVESLRINSLKMKQAKVTVARILIENMDAKAATKIKKGNLLPEKLRLLYRKIVQQSK